MAERTTLRRTRRAKELAALYQAALAITAELSLDKVLQKIAEAARDLADARYAALGVLGEDGGLAQFVTAGLTAEEAAAIGALPTGKGILGLLLQSGKTLRLARITDHPQSSGFPPNHPPMNTFLGVPLIHRNKVVGRLYLTEKAGGAEFTAEDEALIEMLAAQAAVAVENARLFGQTDEALQRKVDELQAERRNLQAIVDQLPEGVAIVDATGENVLLLNRAAKTLLGFDGEQAPVPDKSEAVFRVSQPDAGERAAADVPWKRAVCAGETVAGEQLALIGRGGAVFSALVNAAPLYDANGRAVNGIVAFQDITALKELERLKDELVSIISHELRNPLTAIRGRAQLMLRHARRAPDRQDEVVGLEAIDVQVEKLAEMVRELLDVSQLRLGIIELHRRETDLVQLIRQNVEQFSAIDDQHRYLLETTSAAITGDWDGGRLEQVVSNLLENARKYTPPNGTISMRVDLSTAGALRQAFGRRIGAKTDGTVAVVAVSDDGIGIPTEARHHLFDRFYRAANAKGRAETGLGLGLYVCYEIIAQHGGLIWLDSVEGKGSTFYFALPLRD